VHKNFFGNSEDINHYADLGIRNDNLNMILKRTWLEAVQWI
jgi:hypothetical protein